MDVKRSSVALPRTRSATRAAVLGMMVISAVLVGCASAPKDETADWDAEKLYAQAQEAAAVGGYDKAIKYYEKLEGRGIGSILAQQAQLDRAYALYRINDKAQALSVLERFIKLHPSSAALDYALYMKGLVNFNGDLGFLGSLSGQDPSERDQQASRDAYQAFKQLLLQYPDSPYAADAQLRMNYIVNALADYEVHVARYYYRRGAYLAAANRAQSAVTEFETSPATEEALSIMVSSYGKLGLDTLRDDADRVLRKNFPASRFVEGNVSAAPVASSKPFWKFWN
jgi:outer membrane protein assembly factor BamD